MSKLANTFLNIAESIANSSNSGLAIRILKNGEVKKEYVKKESDKQLIWEDHYKGIAFYLGDMANPVRWDIDVDNQTETVVDAIENAVATKYYKTFMESEALTRIFNIKGPQQETILKLLYASIGLTGLAVVLIIAMFGGM